MRPDVSRRISCIVALVLAACGPAAHAPAPVSAALTDAARLGRLDREFAGRQERLRLPGLAVALLQDGQVIWSKGYGWADLERQVPVTPETPFNIASLTKPITSALLMQLVERGTVSLDEPMARYSKLFRADSVLIRHVLSMTAESHPPGSRYSYNGNVYASLSNVLDAKTHRDFRGLLVRRILDPLDMTRTVPGTDVLDSVAASTATFGSEHLARYRRVSAELAKPYRVFGAGEIVRALPPPPELNAAANVVSTVLDYARFVGGLLAGRLVSDATRSMMWSPSFAPDGTRLPYALGWFVEDYEGLRLIWHHGYWPDDYSSLVLIVPDARVALIAFANADGLSAPFYWTEGVEGNVLACEFLRVVVREGLPCGPVSEAAVARWEAKRTPSTHQVVRVDPSVLVPYVGSYQTPSGRVIGIVKDGDRLWWRTSRGELFELFPETETQFFMKADDRVIRFQRSEGGPVRELELELPGSKVILKRIT